MICEKCEIEIDGTYGSGRFCSRSCANNRGPRSEECKHNISNKLKGTIPWNKNKVLIKNECRECPTCETQFVVKTSSKKIYCTGKCNPNWGGYRDGSGRAKSGYYKGIYCGSTYELAWVIYQIDHNQPFKRFDGAIIGKDIKYIPDFIVGNTIIEIKGYEDEESVSRKTKLAESNGYFVKVLRKEDLINEFNWVKENYSYKTLYELYEDYTPKFTYICNNCETEFSRDFKSKTNDVFCSRFCAGKGHKGHGNKRKFNGIN